jgi:hypothetical protein
MKTLSKVPVPLLLLLLPPRCQNRASGSESLLSRPVFLGSCQRRMNEEEEEEEEEDEEEVTWL